MTLVDAHKCARDDGGTDSYGNKAGDGPLHKAIDTAASESVAVPTDFDAFKDGSGPQSASVPKRASSTIVRDTASWSKKAKAGELLKSDHLAHCTNSVNHVGLAKADGDGTGVDGPIANAAALDIPAENRANNIDPSDDAEGKAGINGAKNVTVLATLAVEVTSIQVVSNPRVGGHLAEDHTTLTAGGDANDDDEHNDNIRAIYGSAANETGADLAKDVGAHDPSGWGDAVKVGRAVKGTVASVRGGVAEKGGLATGDNVPVDADDPEHIDSPRGCDGTTSRDAARANRAFAQAVAWEVDTELTAAVVRATVVGVGGDAREEIGGEVAEVVVVGMMAEASGGTKSAKTCATDGGAIAIMASGVATGVYFAKDYYVTTGWNAAA